VITPARAEPVPGEVGRLTIYVPELSFLGYTDLVKDAPEACRRAVQEALLASGFGVVLDAGLPADAMARVTLTYVEPGETWSVELSSGGTLVEVFQLPNLQTDNSCPETGDCRTVYRKANAQALANRIAGSSELKAWSARGARGTTAKLPAVGSPSPGKRERPQLVVAVFLIHDASGKFKPSILEQLTEYLASRLTELAGYSVVPRDQLRQRLDEAKAESYQQCYDQSCQIELGRAVAAQRSLATNLLQVGNKCAISASLFDLKTEATAGAASVRTDCSDDALMDGVDQLAQKLAAN
jgi:hypothetical protein